jgi:hypothetical protein
MGTVYLGHDPYIDRQVAIKVAHAEQLSDEEGGEKCSLTKRTPQAA